MKPKLYIHIGFPKTGSTTIQKFLNFNKYLLKEKGIFYPDPLVGPQIQGHEGHASMVEADSQFRNDIVPWYVYRKKYFDALKNNSCMKSILSSEALAYENPNNLAMFKENFDVRIVCFFRNFFDYADSLQKQLIKENLRVDVFKAAWNVKRNILAQVENYISFFGNENCIFLNYDESKKRKNTLEVFLNSIGLSMNIAKSRTESANVTPCDAVTAFFYHMLFLPFNFKEWKIIRKSVLSVDMSPWRDINYSFLPNDFFLLDEQCKMAIKRQGELLKDNEWYAYTLKQGENLSKILYRSLPPEVFRYIWERISNQARDIIASHWIKFNQQETSTFLPTYDKIMPETFQLLDCIRSGYVSCLGANFQLRQKLHVLEKDKERVSKNILIRRRLALQVVNNKKGMSNIVNLLRFRFFFRYTYQIHLIRYSGLFDIGWYLEQYPDVAKAGIDPVLHYVRCGAKEGRDPAPWFSTRTYLEAYPDVAASGVNPFYHYIRYGCSEGREKYTC